ncbi:MAG: 5'-3' DNA helicase [Bacteroidetes bacterium]|nr:MAG: 5'-3' DNA helicase [Bacteroidota bacterium]
MTLVIDNIPIDENNPEFRYAAEFVLHTNRMLYLTGKAGTGKTTFLKLLKHISNKNMVVLAPTGVAAVNAGGQTIHSFFNIKPSVYVPGDKRLRVRVPPDDPDKSMINDHFRYHRDKLEIIRGLELLVIDEISMVRCDLLDVIDRLLRVFRKREFTPFGGVQVVLIGDTFQLPPIVNQDDWSILGQFYKSPFFFSSRALQDQKPVYIELKKIYRQTDQDFIDLLNRIRINSLDPGDLSLLNSRFLHGFTPEQEEDYIILATHNRMVEETNEMRLREINEPLHRFEAMVDGIFPETSYPADAMLKLKEGAQVMFLRNDRNKRFYNGKIGHVIEISEEGLFVQLPEGEIISVEREEWANIRYSWDSKESKVIEDPVGSFVQYPLKLAWAITVHKSQGLTFEKIIADLGEAFAPGQVYVALSRCTSFPGVLLKTPLTGRAIMTDPVVLEFAGNETPETLIISELEKGKADNFLKRALSAYRIRDYQKAGTLFHAYMEQPSEKGYDRGMRLFSYAIGRFLKQANIHVGYSGIKDGSAGELSITGKQTSATLPDQRKLLRQLEVKLQAQVLLAEVLTDLLQKIPDVFGKDFIQTGFSAQLEQLAGSLRQALKNVKEQKKSSGRKKKS